MSKGFRKFLNLCIFCIFGLIGFIDACFAAVPTITSVQSSGDLLVINTSGDISGLYIGTSSNPNKATYYKKSDYCNSTHRCIVSLKNGTYYIWIIGNGIDLISGAQTIAYGNNPVKIESSCINESKLDRTDSGTVQRCLIAKPGASAVPDVSSTLVTCKDGYDLKLGVKQNGCSNVSMIVGTNTFPKGRYCKVIYSYTCTKKSSGGGGGGGNSGGGGGGNVVASASLSELSLSKGKLSPEFSSKTKSYKVDVAADVDSVKINATPAKGSSLVSGYGSRTVDLNYGNNHLVVKVKNSAGKVTLYTIDVNRDDSRSKVNTIEDLVISDGTLSPEFSSSVSTYVLKLAPTIDRITVGCTLTDSNSSFIDGFGPREIEINDETKNFYIKVKSESGVQNVYTINIAKDDIPEECLVGIEERALLQSIELTALGSNVPSLNFDPLTKVYDLTVSNEVASLDVNASVNDEGDTVTVVGNEALSVEELNTITITVTSGVCPSITNTYTINVTRSSEMILNSEVYLEKLSIKGHDEVNSKFEKGKLEYTLVLAKGETSIPMRDFTYEANPNSVCDISGNDKLQLNSTIKITCTAEDGEHSVEYVLTVGEVKKGVNTFLVIVFVIIAILLLIYFILRLLGYKIVLNFGMVGAFFRGLGEKIKGLFDR